MSPMYPQDNWKGQCIWSFETSYSNWCLGRICEPSSFWWITHDDILNGETLTTISWQKTCEELKWKTFHTPTDMMCHYMLHAKVAQKNSCWARWEKDVERTHGSVKLQYLMKWMYSGDSMRLKARWNFSAISPYNILQFYIITRGSWFILHAI